jgi:hypothetical protein
MFPTTFPTHENIILSSDFPHTSLDFWGPLGTLASAFLAEGRGHVKTAWPSRSVVGRGIFLSSEVATPIRSGAAVAGVLRGSGDGVHGSRRADDRGRASLLPHDEESVRTDGDAGLPRLLQESSARSSR